jgi:polyphosphate kinase
MHGADSLVPGLIEAAGAQKQAVCMVELKALRRERRNIRWRRS